MPNARDVILTHIDAVNGRDSDADPWGRRCGGNSARRPGQRPRHLFFDQMDFLGQLGLLPG